MNDLLEKNDIEEFHKHITEYFDMFKLSKGKVALRGSSQYKNLIYRSDFDLLCSIKRTTTPAQLYPDLIKVLQRIDLDLNTFFIELKIQTKGDKKTRLYPGNNFSLSVLEKDYSEIAFIKIDVVVRIKNRFYEISCIYKFTDKPELTSQEVIEYLEDDIKEYIAEGNYYKVLKRLFSIYIINNNVSQLEFLFRIFNSELGKS